MCVGEMANLYESMENRMLTEVDRVCQEVNTVDVQMDKVHDQMRDFDMRVAEVKEHVGAAERTHNTLDALMNWHQPRVLLLEREVRELQQQVGDLLMFRAVLQHGPGNPVEVEDDDEDEEDLEVPMFLAGGEGQLVLIKDDELPAEVVAQQILDDGGPALLYEEGEEVPGYEEAPEYQIPPIVD